MNILYYGDNVIILHENTCDGLNFKRAKKEKGKDQPKLFE